VHGLGRRMAHPGVPDTRGRLRRPRGHDHRGTDQGQQLHPMQRAFIPTTPSSADTAPRARSCRRWRCSAKGTPLATQRSAPSCSSAHARSSGTCARCSQRSTASRHGAGHARRASDSSLGPARGDVLDPRLQRRAHQHLGGRNRRPGHRPGPSTGATGRRSTTVMPVPTYGAATGAEELRSWT
jgi:hypothetical protein